MLSLNTIEGQAFIKELTRRQTVWADLINQNYSKDLQKIEERLKKSETVLSDQGQLIRTPLHDIVNILQDTVNLLAKYQPRFSEELARFKNQADEFCNILAVPNELALIQWTNENKVSPFLVGQLFDWVLRPEKMALGKFIQPLLHDKIIWNKHFCPICGEEAEIALLLTENGERHLGCSSCQVTWKYSRLKCIFCHSTDPEKLKYYFVENAPEQQIHYCQSCNKYLKTFDQRFSKEIFQDLMQLNLMTVHLDVLAEEKGLEIKSLQ